MRLFVRVWAALLSGVFLFGTAALAEPLPTFNEAGIHAVDDLVRDFYVDGKWRECDRNDCTATNSDWGADSATYTLYLSWERTHDPRAAAKMSELLATAPRYGAPCSKQPCANWSDTPAWDAIAAMREYQVLHDQRALENAKAALRYVQESRAFALGACPSIPSQHPPQDRKRVKTLETTANAVKADLLVYQATHDESYLRAARDGYASARQFFLDPQLPLYTVHVIDNGQTCEQQQGRYFASVNGDMIWNGVVLGRITGEEHYAEEAIATAHAVDNSLGDNRGVFANVQGENDVAEPLVEAMLLLAQRPEGIFARGWIVRNASAALSARAGDGSFSRYFDGPPQSVTSIWETNGGFALEIAAATIEPHLVTSAANGWDARNDTSITVNSLPATIEVNGSGVALVGTIGEECEQGHVRVFIDGAETADRTGLWQNTSMPAGESVLFAWRWSSPGHHTISLEPGDANAAAADAVSLKSYVTK